jgi:S-layer homology domain
MLKKLIGVMIAGLVLSSASGVKAQTYTDYEQIGDWALPYVEELSKMGCYIGYPDGSLRPTTSISRQELAVVLSKCMEAVKADNTLTAEQLRDFNSRLNMMQDQLDEQQKLISEQEQELEEQNRKRDNHVGVGFAYGFNGPGAVAIEGKFRIINLNDTLGISLRPGVNTTKEVFTAVTLDADVMEDLTVYVGAGAAVNFNSDFTGLLTSGRSGDVTPYAQAGAELDLSRTVGVFADVKVPIERDTFSDVVGTVGLFTKF